MNQKIQAEMHAALPFITDRAAVLNEAAKCTLRDRNAVYGEPYANLSHMADLVNSYLKTKYNIQQALSPEDMAIVMALGKIARMGAGAFKLDNYVDAAAYVAIAAECAEFSRVIAEQDFAEAETKDC